MLRPLSLLGLLGLVFTVACGSEVIVDDDGSGGEGGQPSCMDFAECEPEPVPAECPATQPEEGASCNLPDSMQCDYPYEAGYDCSSRFECMPVYPEDGAPSEWVYAGEYGEECYVDECVPTSCDPGDEQVGACTDGFRCYEKVYVDDPCYTVILCADTAEPANDCQWSPEGFSSCVYDGASCLVEEPGGCFTDYECIDGVWNPVAGGCGGE